jgi:hypothetical protein
VINQMQTDDMELKKLVYLYLINYAKTQPDLAIMAVNTFVKVSGQQQGAGGRAAGAMRRGGAPGCGVARSALNCMAMSCIAQMTLFSTCLPLPRHLPACVPACL